jgi:hypothetical protein
MPSAVLPAGVGATVALIGVGVIVAALVMVAAAVGVAGVVVLVEVAAAVGVAGVVVLVTVAAAVGVAGITVLVGVGTKVAVATLCVGVAVARGCVGESVAVAAAPGVGPAPISTPELPHAASNAIISSAIKPGDFIIVLIARRGVAWHGTFHTLHGNKRMVEQARMTVKRRRIGFDNLTSTCYTSQPSWVEGL